MNVNIKVKSGLPCRGFVPEGLCGINFAFELLNSIQKCEHFDITHHFSPHSFTFWSSCTKYGGRALYSVISYVLGTISRSFVSMQGCQEYCGYEMPSSPAEAEGGGGVEVVSHLFFCWGS